MSNENEGDNGNDQKRHKIYVVVARHGERWDYVQRDAGINWIATAERPWDPPLSPNGLKQATRLGTHLKAKLVELNLPPIVACYSSPFLRCRQTACRAVQAIVNDGNHHNGNKMLVQIELGLSESLNNGWYRSWALPGADGTWGFVPAEDMHPGKRRRGLDEFTTLELHPCSQVPVQRLLDWQEVVHPDSPDLTSWQDMQYTSSTSIWKPFALTPQVILETVQEQRERMLEVVVNKAHQGQTILLVSHGGPVTHLYEKVTGNEWYVHGESKYCCYSIYECESPNKFSEVWKTLVVNESEYLDDLWSDGTANI
jgi:broad specificity phosphatase PhoE